MKIILTAQDQAQAINEYINDNYGLDLSIDSSEFDDKDMEIQPMKDKPEDSEREEAEKRAEELGISFRSDIKTSTLISRIEEEEERIAEQVRQPDPLPMDEPEEEDNGMEESEQTKEEEDTPEQDKEEEQEKQPVIPKKKPSIFGDK